MSATLYGHDLASAANSFDLAALRRAVVSLPAHALAAPDSRGFTVIHHLAASLFFFKAGELSQLVPWFNTSRTVYTRTVHDALYRALQVCFIDMTVPTALGPANASLASHSCAHERLRSR